MVVRIIIITLLSATISFHVFLHWSSSESHSATSRWRQPESLNSDFPTLVDTNKWSVDFAPIEALIQHLSLRHDQQLLVNFATREILIRLDTLLPEKASFDEKKRIQFLITKNLPQPANEQLIELMNGYRQYNQNTRDMEGLTKLDLQEQHNIKKQYQVRFFGEDTANKLFADKNLTTQYLLDRQRINQQTTLSPEEKLAALAELKSTYQQAQAKYDR